MNLPSMAISPPSLARIAARSAAVNVPLFGALASCTMGLMAYFTYRGPAQRRREFLKALAATECPDAAFLRYFDAADPPYRAVEDLRGADLPGAVRTSVRKALANSL